MKATTTHGLTVDGLHLVHADPRPVTAAEAPILGSRRVHVGLGRALRRIVGAVVAFVRRKPRELVRAPPQVVKVRNRGALLDANTGTVEPDVV